MTQTIQILLTILLSVSIVAVIRLWSVLGSARVTLANLEATRQEADKTLKQLALVAASTDKMLREEVAPTLQMTRATLENVEVTTRALAQTTRAVQRITGRAESLTSAQRLLALGGSIAQNVFAAKANGNKAGANAALDNGGNKTAVPASGSVGFNIAFAVTSRLRGLFARRGEPQAGVKPPIRQIAPAADATDVQFESGTRAVSDNLPYGLITQAEDDFAPAPGAASGEMSDHTISGGAASPEMRETEMREAVTTGRS